jgi:hypothetical protein
LAKIKLLVVPPLDTKFGRYKLEPGVGFVLKQSMGHHHIPLHGIHLAQLLAVGETHVGIAEAPGEGHCDESEMICVVEEESPVRANLSMVRITGSELLRLFSELPLPTRTEAGESVSSAAANPSSSGPGWSIKKPERVVDSLTTMIYGVLKDAYAAGEPCPKARDVMDRLAEKKPPDFLQVADDSISFLDLDGNAETANIDAVRNRIKRMTAVKPPANAR